MKLLVSLFLLAFLLLVASARVVHKVTPLEKVIELLEKTRDEAAAEGQQEAKDYDEFACFCKEQADNKLYAIGKSKEKIEAQTAKIEALDAEITQLNGKIEALNKHKTQLESEQQKADEQRASEFVVYSDAEKQLAITISKVEDAVEALEESKQEMSDSKLNLAQVRTEIKKAVTSKASAVDPKRLEAFLDAFDTEMAASSKPHASQYKSNGIIATLKGLLKQFKQNKVDLDTEEAGTRNAYEMAKQAKENTIKFTGQDIEEKSSLEQDKSKEKQQTEQARKEETEDMNADQTFLDDLTTQCEDKAKTFDQRSNTRVAELTAIAKALEILKSGAQPNYDANGKLTMLIQQHVVNSQMHQGVTQQKPQSQVQNEELSFVQLRGSENGPSKAGMEVLTYLSRKANVLSSPTLSMLAVKVQLELGKDHFVKVRGMIKDLIEKLEADAESEAGQKSFCDENMAKATSDRDAAIGNVETQTANIDQAESTLAKLVEEIDELGNSIADLRKGLFEQTELREAEKAENMKTIEDSTAGLSAVDGAIKVLKEFYEGAFIQQKFVPAKADSEGNTVADLAPDTATEDYHGNQDAAKGIFGLLEVIKSDFERTIETTKADEEKADAEFEEFTAASKQDLEEKGKSKKDNEKKKTDTESDLTDFKDQLKDEQKNLADAKEELEKLKPVCVDTGMDWEERRARQKQEIEALKEALDILSEI
eukprot:gnl/MRDRNA2_/MRDRNA2_92076_c0_seq1.p1 gnl/MRDRNA2_/MRDRNA2_92076_c0~~gnl/MRDRNA2_/MRDRNA2_92076_c0_seq1.p1  ORF type:complete len:729 (+),score=226.84 gnl/MRDRNA2_/MRDRNA2_92076_c0_seq1:63-2189(+)